MSDPIAVAEKRRFGPGCGQIVAGLLIAFAAIFFAAPFVSKSRRIANEQACANNLRRIGMAAAQYAAAHQAYPHFAKLSVLDPGWRSDVASCATRKLFEGGHLDDPTLLVCPESPDTARRALPPTDLTLDKATHLSYGWTRRGLTPNSTPTNLVAGDKARVVQRCWHCEQEGNVATARVGNMVGNHKAYMAVVTVAGGVVRVTPTADQLTTANLGALKAPGGCLGVLDDEEHE